ncbi:MAG: LacI family DNA-binding transcriptional regulator [Chthoniobacterales bacterium]
MTTKYHFIPRTHAVKSRQNMQSANAPAIKMQDIAERLGLSVATVSRSLRKIPGINPRTRARVMQAAAELGYRIPDSYRGNGSEETSLKHIGILLETDNQSTDHPYLIGMSEASMHLNVSLNIHYVKKSECEQVLDSKKQPRAMQAGLLSGIILIFRWPYEVVQKLAQKYPTVSIMHQYAGIEIDTVGIDNEGGMELLIKRLHALGHRKIAFMGRCPHLHWANARFGGFVSALSASELEYHPKWVVDAAFETLATADGNWESSHKKIDQVMQDGVTAWICASEPAGWHLHRYLQSRGLQIPRDVSITGFHRPTLASTHKPDLTSVGASYEHIGAAALKRLCQRLQNPLESPHITLFPAEYYPGTSTGLAS